ncbi:hypothetical protein KR074_008941 [Drosophila pseudoananassae]|nr:hypothetical protein KR074_008941 [Drosophila pseudoananassae]
MYFLGLSLFALLPALVLSHLCDVKPSNAFLKKRSFLNEGERKFALSMLEEIYNSNPNQNLFVSPYSVYNALLLAYYGSAGTTQNELVSTLSLDWADSKEMVRSVYMLQKWKHGKMASEAALEFSSVDRVFLSQNLATHKCFENRLGNDIIKKDFENNAVQALEDINDWIANVTHNHIRDVLTSQEINSRTQVVLANAAFFKGQWVSQFKKHNTVSKPFFTSSNRSSMVPMMQQKGAFKIKADNALDAHVLQLPFRTSQTSETESDVSMVVVLPSFKENAIPELLSKLDSNSLESALKWSMPQEIEISIPKFEFEQHTSLIPILSKMGINEMFNERRANFSELTPDHISFGEALHVAKIKVDEEGSTAAAATVLISSRSARPLEPFKFECNHPFVFFIYNMKFKSILFSGVYAEPIPAKQ